MTNNISENFITIIAPETGELTTKFNKEDYVGNKDEMPSNFQFDTSAGTVTGIAYPSTYGSSDGKITKSHVWAINKFFEDNNLDGPRSENDSPSEILEKLVYLSSKGYMATIKTTDTMILMFLPKPGKFTMGELLYLKAQQQELSNVNTIVVGYAVEDKPLDELGKVDKKQQGPSFERYRCLNEAEYFSLPVETDYMMKLITDYYIENKQQTMSGSEENKKAYQKVV